MARPRPRRAYRPPLAVRIGRVAAPVALVGLGTAGAFAFTSPGSADPQSAVPAPVTSTSAGPATSAPAAREQPVSRSVVRPTPTPTASAKPATAKAKAPAAPPAAPALKVTDSKYATDDLNIRIDPDKKSDVVTVVDPGTKLKVTDTVRDGFRYVSFDGKGRWVTDSYLSDTKPDPATTGGTTMAPCDLGSGMEKGLTPDAILVHRTVCARYPQVTSFGGVRSGDGFHATGQAVDCMISDSAEGWVIARWVRAHAKELGVSEVIHAQHIWTVQRSSEGWRKMADRGSATANHYDHVHVSVYGNRATG